MAVLTSGCVSLWLMWIYLKCNAQTILALENHRCAVTSVRGTTKTRVQLFIATEKTRFNCE